MMLRGLGSQQALKCFLSLYFAAPSNAVEIQACSEKQALSNPYCL